MCHETLDGALETPSQLVKKKKKQACYDLEKHKATDPLIWQILPH